MGPISFRERYSPPGRCLPLYSPPYGLPIPRAETFPPFRGRPHPSNAGALLTVTARSGGFLEQGQALSPRTPLSRFSDVPAVILSDSGWRFLLNWCSQSPYPIGSGAISQETFFFSSFPLFFLYPSLNLKGKWGVLRVLRYPAIRAPSNQSRKEVIR